MDGPRGSGGRWQIGRLEDHSLKYLAVGISFTFLYSLTIFSRTSVNFVGISLVSRVISLLGSLVSATSIPVAVAVVVVVAAVVSIVALLPTGTAAAEARPRRPNTVGVMNRIVMSESQVGSRSIRGRSRQSKGIYKIELSGVGPGRFVASKNFRRRVRKGLSERKCLGEVSPEHRGRRSRGETARTVMDER